MSSEGEADCSHEEASAASRGSDEVATYGDRQNHFITRHRVASRGEALPTLGPAHPLTEAFVDSLAQSLYGSAKAEVLPDHILAKGGRMIAWWTPTRRRQMFYQNSEQKGAALNGCTFLQPALVWRVETATLRSAGCATTKGRKPRGSWRSLHSGTSPTAVGPAWGSMRRPESATVASIESWERGFYESAFTHSNVGRLTLHKQGFEGLWGSLAGKRKVFPTGMLIALPQTHSRRKGLDPSDRRRLGRSQEIDPILRPC
jgi:PRTRC genetic system protein B